MLRQNLLLTDGKKNNWYVTRLAFLRAKSWQSLRTRLLITPKLVCNCMKGMSLNCERHGIQTFPLKRNVSKTISNYSSGSHRFYKDFSEWSQCIQLVLLISSNEPLIRVKAAPQSTPQRWAVSSNRRSWTRGSWRWRCVVNSATGKHAPPARSAGCICQIKTSHDGKQ